MKYVCYWILNIPLMKIFFLGNDHVLITYILVIKSDLHEVLIFLLVLIYEGRMPSYLISTCSIDLDQVRLVFVYTF